MVSFTCPNPTVVFSDDFENTLYQWSTSGTYNTWGLTSSKYHSASNSLTDSPSGDYVNYTVSYATMVSGVDLSSVVSAQLSFWTTYIIETNYDFMYVDVSTDDFATWDVLATFTGTNTSWLRYLYNLDNYVGNSNVKIRFRFVTDYSEVREGIYIDDVEIVACTNSP